MALLEHVLCIGVVSMACSILLFPASASMAYPDASLSVAETGASGSEFSTTATATEGSPQITVADVGDFKVGQGVMVSKCNIHFIGGRLWGPGGQHAKNKPLETECEYRGYDGTKGSWTPYVVDIPKVSPAVFRWSDDLGRTWSEEKPITDGWQPLSGGVEIKFGEHDWQQGWVITFAGRDQLVSVIEQIEGNTLTLRDAANRTVTDAVVRHCDDAAIQAAVDRGIAEKRNAYFPPGHYRLAAGITVANPMGITLEGPNGVDAVLDISEGEGACIRLRDGKEATLRNLCFVGGSGFDQRDQMGHLRTKGATGVWGFYFMHCNALGISNTERVLVENCHARKMSAECFYSAGRSRVADKEPAQYTKAITYLRCSVEDCARNAFNNNDMAENTSVLNCRVVDVGGCTWEGASRFVKFCGNYVRNGGTVAMGNVRSRAEHYEHLPTGQHLVSDNVFESGVCYGGCQVRAAAGAVQVLVTDNTFANFGTSAIEIIGQADNRHLPAETSTISGNVIDLTSFLEEPQKRWAVMVTGSHVIVSDNQVYVRGETDSDVTAIRLREPAVNINVHDNLIRGCGTGIMAERADSRVTEVIDERTFAALPSARVHFERRLSHRYRGWHVVWLENGAAVGESIIEGFDPEECRFTLTEPRDMRVNDAFEVYSPTGTNWMLHSNTITDCTAPLVLDCYGSATAVARNNTITRGQASGVAQAILVAGRFSLIGNLISGFDEPESATLRLRPDRLGNPPPNVYRDNVFEDCRNVLDAESRPLWQAATTSGNEFIGCANQP